MKPNLEGVDLKLARGKECLAFLDAEQLGFVERTPACVVGEYDPKNGDYVFRVAGEPPPLVWGITLGEFAHALRSALDNLLWQLVLERGTHLPTGDTQFPIYENKIKFGRNVARLTKGASAPDLAFIEMVQPYHLRSHPNAALPKSRWHPLALLSHLNNTDKHRFLQACVTMPTVSTFPGGQTTSAFVSALDRLELGEPAFTLRGPGLEIPMMPVSGFILSFRYLDGSFVQHEGTSHGNGDEERMVLVRVLKPDRPNTEMRMNAMPTFAISFSGRERPMHIGDLHDIQQQVVEIVDHFRPAFC